MNKLAGRLTILSLSAAFAFLVSLDLPAQVRSQLNTLQKRPDVLRLKLPDLTVSFPSKPQSGKFQSWQKISRGIRVDVKNIGTAAASNFFVDFILSTDTSAPVKYAVFAANFHEDVLIKGGRLHIQSLAPGAVRSLLLPAPVTMPAHTPAVKNLYIGVVVDSGRSVKESNEKNNTAFLKFTPPQKPLAQITSINELGVMPSNTGNVELHINGSGFGSTMGSKVVKMGSYTLEVESAGSWTNWEDGYIATKVPANVPYGVYYNVYLMENGKIISNKKQILLKIDLEGCYIQVGNQYDVQAEPGSPLELHGTEFGQTQGNQHIRFGSLTVPPTSWTNHRVTFACPNLPPGSYQVWIEKNGLDITLQKRPFQVLPH
jgi:hypothetical protein